MKIEEFNKKNEIAKKLTKDVSCALGEDKSDNDKHLVGAKFIGLDLDNWSEMIIHIHASYGYRGSSSGYTASSKELGHYLSQAIAAKLPELMKDAVARAQADAEKARLEAKAEAEEVLKAILPP